MGLCSNNKAPAKVLNSHLVPPVPPETEESVLQLKKIPYVIHTWLKHAHLLQTASDIVSLFKGCIF